MAANLSLSLIFSFLPLIILSTAFCLFTRRLHRSYSRDPWLAVGHRGNLHHPKPQELQSWPESSLILTPFNPWLQVVVFPLASNFTPSVSYCKCSNWAVFLLLCRNLCVQDHISYIHMMYIKFNLQMNLLLQCFYWLGFGAGWKKNWEMFHKGHKQKMFLTIARMPAFWTRLTISLCFGRSCHAFSDCFTQIVKYQFAEFVGFTAFRYYNAQNPPPPLSLGLVLSSGGQFPVFSPWCLLS